MRSSGGIWCQIRSNNSIKTYFRKISSRVIRGEMTQFEMSQFASEWASMIAGDLEWPWYVFFGFWPFLSDTIVKYPMFFTATLHIEEDLTRGELFVLSIKFNYSFIIKFPKISNLFQIFQKIPLLIWFQVAGLKVEFEIYSKL